MPQFLDNVMAAEIKAPPTEPKILVRFMTVSARNLLSVSLNGKLYYVQPGNVTIRVNFTFDTVLNVVVTHLADPKKETTSPPLIGLDYSFWKV